jgi:hypothetical protein
MIAAESGLLYQKIWSLVQKRSFEDVI